MAVKVAVNKGTEAKETKGVNFKITVKCGSVTGVSQAMKWLESHAYQYTISKN